MQITLNRLDFGVVSPRGSADRTLTIAHVSPEARVSAAVVEDNSQGRFKILSVESDPGESSQAGRIEITLRFYSLVPKGQDDFKAVLVIQDSEAKSQQSAIRIEMIALVGNISTLLPAVVRVTRGHRASVPVTVVSQAGPDTTVSYSAIRPPSGISIAPIQVSLSRGKRVTTHLEVAATSTVLLGTQNVMLEARAFDGRLVTRSKLVLQVPVTPVPELELPTLQPADRCQYFESLSGIWAQQDQVLDNWGIVDLPETCVGFSPSAKLFQPTNPYEIANAIREAEADGTTIRAVGSRWSFSDAVLPQSVPIEGVDAEWLRHEALSGHADEATLRSASANLSNHFGYVVDTSRLDENLSILLPSILDDHHSTDGLFFAEAGMTIHRLNHLLDSQMPRLALKTMGGAVGQTIAGAISTGTHGGDFDRPPLGDSARAIYLVGKGTGIGMGGTHHWVESKTRRVTDPERIRAAFPCIQTRNIHYDDEMLRALLVSMGAMGVIYAVILDVVQQYSLLEFNRSLLTLPVSPVAPSQQLTWEGLRNDLLASDFEDLFNGRWTGMEEYLLTELQIENATNRFVQVVINPIRTEYGHNCCVTNRAELPLRSPSGIAPASDYSQVAGDILSAILNSPEAGPLELLTFWWGRHLGEFGSDSDPLIVRLRKLIAFCKFHNYPWAIRAVIDEVMRKFFPLPTNPLGPQIGDSFKVMAPGDPTRSFPMLGITSLEPAFSFHPRTDHPGADVITFVDAVLRIVDEGVERDRVFPGGYVALRVTGRTDALLGMERFERNGHVEFSLVGNPDDYELVRRIQQMALDMGGTLHWGQSNGLMTFREVGAAYGDANIALWRQYQQILGGGTFTNFFMKRCGLIPSPILRVEPILVQFDLTAVHDLRTLTFAIMNIGSGLLDVSLPASTAGNFRWSQTSFQIPPGGVEEVQVNFTPETAGNKSQTLFLRSNAPGSPHPVALEGQGDVEQHLPL
jgi:hypothetical protein